MLHRLDCHPLAWPARAAIVFALLVTTATAAARDRDDPDEPAVHALDPATVVPGRVLLDTDDLDALRERLDRAVFRAEARHLLDEPYQKTPIVADGAVVAVRTGDGELGFLTSAIWLEHAETITLIDPEGDGTDGLELVIERRDLRVDLALLRARDSELDDSQFTALELATTTPMMTWALVSPQTRYAQLTSMSVLPSEAEQLEGGGTSIYWPSTLAAVNGYPAVDADGRIVAIHARRSIDIQRGLAVGWPTVADFLDPEAERTTPGGRELARPREPDRVLRSRLLEKIRSRDKPNARAILEAKKKKATGSPDAEPSEAAPTNAEPTDEPFRYQFGGRRGGAIVFGER